MPLVALRTADFDPRRRVEAFKAAAAHICKLDIVPNADSEYRSETVIAVAPDLVIADTSHSACITMRDQRLAAETGDNVLIHVPMAGGGFDPMTHCKREAARSEHRKSAMLEGVAGIMRYDNHIAVPTCRPARQQRTKLGTIAGEGARPLTTPRPASRYRGPRETLRSH